jgi:Tfp pilus assembly protein FimT
MKTLPFMPLPPSFKRGFSIVELLVTIGVFVMLSLSLVGNYRSSTKALSLNSLAALVSSDIRRAQAYGISNIDRGGYFAHGISFDTTIAANKTFYILFADKNSNLINDNLGVCTGECVEKMTISSGSRIKSLCVNMKKDNKTSANCTAVNSLHISFKRPEPEPSIISSPAVSEIADAEIFIETGDGALIKTIVVWKTGLIATE